MNPAVNVNVNVAVPMARAVTMPTFADRKMAPLVAAAREAGDVPIVQAQPIS